MQIQSLIKKASSDKDFLEKLQADPISTMQEEAGKHPLQTDNWIYRLIIFFLGLVIIIIVTGVIILVSMGIINSDFDTPQILVAMGSGALGALAGLLAPSPATTNNSNT